MPSILFVNVLDDLFATLMFEIDVDIGSFIAFATDEAFEEKIVLAGIHTGYPEAKANSAIGGRTATLAQNVPRPGESDQVPDGQEIGLIVQVLDDRELVLEHGDHGVRDAARVSLFSTLPRQLLEVIDRCYTRW